MRGGGRRRGVGAGDTDGAQVGGVRDESEKAGASVVGA